MTSSTSFQTWFPVRFLRTKPPKEDDISGSIHPRATTRGFLETVIICYIKYMKGLLRHFVIDTFAIYIASKLATGMVFGNNYKTLFLTGIVMALVSLLAKPVINILLLPLNLVTFG